jgi:hypothetical protein
LEEYAVLIADVFGTLGVGPLCGHMVEVPDMSGRALMPCSRSVSCGAAEVPWFTERLMNRMVLDRADAFEIRKFVIERVEISMVDMEAFRNRTMRGLPDLLMEPAHARLAVRKARYVVVRLCPVFAIGIPSKDHPVELDDVHPHARIISPYRSASRRTRPRGVHTG